MMDKLKARWNKVSNQAIQVLATRENVLIIQIHPKKRVITASYKKKVRKGLFQDNTIKNMMKGGIEFRPNTEKVLGAAAQLIEQLINEQ